MNGRSGCVWFLTCLAALVLGGCGTPGAQMREVPQQQERAVEILAQWQGQVRVETRWDGPVPVKDSGFVVVRDQAALDAFIERIPKRRVQKRQPAPPSKDPLLQDFSMDFDRYMLLVSIRSANMYAIAPIEGVVAGSGGCAVDISLPPLGETAIMATAMDIGTYFAVKVARCDGPVEPRYTSSVQPGP